MRDTMDNMEGDMLDNKKRTARLKAEIEAGYMPIVQNASMVRGEYAMGDIVNIGWAEKEYITDYQGEVEGVKWWYNGPAPFKLATMGRPEPEVIQPKSWVGDTDL